MRVLIAKPTWQESKCHQKYPTFGYFHQLLVNHDKIVKIYEKEHIKEAKTHL